VLKTAVMVLAHAAAHGADPLDLAAINHVREQYLGLSPIGALAGSGGLGEVIALLAAPA
jgi:ABC-type proline/glycine betaine transport system permease subunit